MEILLPSSAYNMSPPISAVLLSNLLWLILMLLCMKLSAPPTRRTPVTFLTINQVRVVVTRFRDSTDSITVPNWLPTKVQLTISAVEFINVSDVPVPASPSNHIPRKTTLSAFLIELLPQPMKVILLTETNSADSKEKCEDDLHLTVVLKASEYISKLLKFENEKFMTRL